MKRVLALLCLMLGSQSAGCASMANNADQQNRYVYCNVYAASACFGVASGDVMTMRVPVDFVTYDLELFGGVKVLIYSGYNPPKIAARNSHHAKRYSVPSGSYEHILTSDGRHVITYTPLDTSLPLLQVEVDQVGASQKEVFADFLKAFRPCKSDGASVVCDKGLVLFNDVAQKIRAIKGD